MSIKNVLLVTIDSLRFDHLELFADELDPDFEFLSFEKAFATGPGTSPSFPGLLTGTLPLSYDGLGPLSPNRPRLAAHLQTVGLNTGGFQSNPFLSHHFNYEVGFKTFEDYQNPLMGIATKIFPRGIEINNPRLRRIDEFLRITDAIKKTYQAVRGKPRPYVDAEVITDDTLNWLAETDTPFFCWPHYMDVHHPCFPPEQYRSSFDVEYVTQTKVSELYSMLLTNPDAITARQLDELEALYRGSIVYVAHQINRLLQYLQDMEKADETLVIITSDHGELFGEHDQYGKPERMYDELLQVPLFIANGPSYLDPVTDDIVSLLDVPPLIHDVLELNIPDSYAGRRPGADESREYIVAEHEVGGNVIVGARLTDWLFEADQIRDEQRLFRVRDGALEQVNNAPDNPRARRAKEIVLDRLHNLDIEQRQLQDEIDGDVEDRLSDLGYL
jgi:arylsulfatase A-like enzyme